MAAEIKPSQSLEKHRRGSVRKPQLLSKLEGSTDEITAALFIPTEDGVITSSNDRYVNQFGFKNYKFLNVNQFGFKNYKFLYIIII